jgi:hypothetical protein
MYPLSVRKRTKGTEVFRKDAMKKDDRNHPNSMQHGNYRIENWNIRENMIEHGRTTARPLAS